MFFWKNKGRGFGRYGKIYILTFGKQKEIGPPSIGVTPKDKEK